MDLLVPFVAKMPKPNGKSLGKMNSNAALLYVVFVKPDSHSFSE